MTDTAANATGTIIGEPEVVEDRSSLTDAALTAAAIVGDERATELFEAAYDEHARRLAKLYENLGND